MSYQALYRKFRPQEFESVKGQEHIVTSLKNQINHDRIGHAYLFCGTRGTGKTTVAKIFAKAVNCEHPIDGSPCGECATCKAIAAGSSMNVIEIDAASNNGVDNIREIREEVAYSPTTGKYKVYIIDEVHMLSSGAFNALLKTLEEPPAYVIFILATTEVHKIPVTILSRCQRYDFRRITIDTIADRLKELMQVEGIAAEEKAVRYIAKAADGSMRDALSLLDQCIAFYLGQELTYERVLDVLGAVDTEIFSHLLRHIMEENVSGAMQVIENLMVEGRELNQFVNDFCWYLRNLLLMQSSDEMEDLLDMSAENLASLKEEAQKIDAVVLMRYIRVFSELSNQIKYSAQKRILIEIAVIKLCKPAMEPSYDALVNRIAQLEKKMEKGIPVAMATAAAGGQPGIAVAVEEKKPKLQMAVPEDIKKIVAQWKTVKSMISGALLSYFSKATPTVDKDGKTLLLSFETEDSMFAKMCESKEHLAEISEVLNQFAGKEVPFRLRALEPGEKIGVDYVDLFQDPLENIHADIEIADDEFV